MNHLLVGEQVMCLNVNKKTFVINSLQSLSTLKVLKSRKIVDLGRWALIGVVCWAIMNICLCITSPVFLVLFPCHKYLPYSSFLSFLWVILCHLLPLSVSFSTELFPNVTSCWEDQVPHIRRIWASSPLVTLSDDSITLRYLEKQLINKM